VTGAARPRAPLDELLCAAEDITGQVRLVVTSPTGRPRRSDGTDPTSIVPTSKVAPITSE
jgi:hypothetical protein